MPDHRPTFRLYVLGQLQGDQTQPRLLTTLADFKERRVVERTRVSSARLTALAKRIDGLRAYIEGGYPEFAEDELRKLGDELFGFIIQDRVKTLLTAAMGDELEYRPFELFVEDY